MSETVSLYDVYQTYQKEDELLVVDEGQYELEVISCSVKSDNSLLPTFKILGGPMQAAAPGEQPVNPIGRRLLAGQFTLSEKSRSIFFQNLKGFGIGESFFAQYRNLGQREVFGILATALVGSKVSVYLAKRDWQGSDRNHIPIGKIKLIGSGTNGAAPAAAVPAAVAAAPAAPPAEAAPAAAAPAPAAAEAAPAPAAAAPAAAAPAPAAAVPAAVPADGDPPF